MYTACTQPYKLWEPHICVHVDGGGEEEVGLCVGVCIMQFIAYQADIGVQSRLHE